jgi:hypothetical protein
MDIAPGTPVKLVSREDGAVVFVPLTPAELAARKKSQYLLVHESIGAVAEATEAAGAIEAEAVFDLLVPGWKKRGLVVYVRCGPGPGPHLIMGGKPPPTS